MSKGRNGFTLIEIMLATVIIAVSVIGLFQAFAYGRAFVDKMGVRRQVLGYVQAEMESLRQARRQLNLAGQSDQPLKFAQKVNQRTVVIDKQKNLKALLQSQVSSPQNRRGLTYQDVSVTISYQGELLADSVHLSTKMYLR